MPFILPEIASRQFLNETGCSLDEFFEPARQAEFKIWYNLKLAEPTPVPQPPEQEAAPEVAPEVPEEELPVDAPAEEIIEIDPLPEA